MIKQITQEGIIIIKNMKIQKDKKEIINDNFRNKLIEAVINE